MEEIQNIQSVIAYFSDVYSSWQEVNRLFITAIHNHGSRDLTTRKTLYEFLNEHNSFQVCDILDDKHLE